MVVALNSIWFPRLEFFKKYNHFLLKFCKWFFFRNSTFQQCPWGPLSLLLRPTMGINVVKCRLLLLKIYFHMPVEKFMSGLSGRLIVTLFYCQKCRKILYSVCFKSVAKLHKWKNRWKVLWKKGGFEIKKIINISLRYIWSITTLPINLYFDQYRVS